MLVQSSTIVAIPLISFIHSLLNSRHFKASHLLVCTFIATENILVELTVRIGQSKNSGIKAVEKIVTLQESASTMKAAIAMLESELIKYVLTNSITVSSVRFDILTNIEVKTHVLTCLQRDINTATNHINLHDKVSAAKLNKIKKEPFFALQMNMRVVKARLCAKLRECKFKLANLEQAYHSKQMGMSIFCNTACIITLMA